MAASVLAIHYLLVLLLVLCGAGCLYIGYVLARGPKGGNAVQSNLTFKFGGTEFALASGSVATLVVGVSVVWVGAAVLIRPKIEYSSEGGIDRLSVVASVDAETRRAIELGVREGVSAVMDEHTIVTTSGSTAQFYEAPARAPEESTEAASAAMVAEVAADTKTVLKNQLALQQTIGDQMEVLAKASYSVAEAQRQAELDRAQALAELAKQAKDRASALQERNRAPASVAPEPEPAKPTQEDGPSEVGDDPDI